MIPHAISYEPPPLRCESCDGTGEVDDTVNYLAQFAAGGTVTYFYDGVGPPTAPCRTCYGTGRHVARARAGLAAPPRIFFDIETRGMDWRFDEATLAADKAEFDLLHPFQRAALMEMFGAFYDRRPFCFDPLIGRAGGGEP